LFLSSGIFVLLATDSFLSMLCVVGSPAIRAAPGEQHRLQIGPVEVGVNTRYSLDTPPRCDRVAVLRSQAFWVALNVIVLDMDSSVSRAGRPPAPTGRAGKHHRSASRKSVCRAAALHSVTRRATLAVLANVPWVADISALADDTRPTDR
jgi:hypothetical protein